MSVRTKKSPVLFTVRQGSTIYKICHDPHNKVFHKSLNAPYFWYRINVDLLRQEFNRAATFEIALRAIMHDQPDFWSKKNV